MSSFVNVAFVVNSRLLKEFEDENVGEFEYANFNSNNNVNILDCSRFVNDNRIKKFDLEDVILINENSYFRKY